MTRALPHLTVLVVLTGCTQNTLTEDDAAVAWEATSQELNRSAGDAVTAGLDGSFDVTCLDGGTLNASGSWSAEANREDQSAETTFAYELDFDGCSRDGVTIDGGIDFEGSATASLSEMSTEVTMSWTGQLDYTGDVEGTCVVDVTATAMASMSVGASVSFEGTLCDNDVTAFANVTP